MGRKCLSEYWSVICGLLGLSETMTAKDPALRCCEVTVSLQEMPGKCPGKKSQLKPTFLLWYIKT